MAERRAAVMRWLTFGPMFVPSDPREQLKAALRNRENAMKFGARVTRSGGPAAPGLFKHKTFTSQGNLQVRRGTRVVTVKRRDASAATKKAWSTRKRKYGKSGRGSKNSFGKKGSKRVIRGGK